jgi:uncharacterized protein YndB with AHSA1/START domain
LIGRNLGLEEPAPNQKRGFGWTTARRNVGSGANEVSAMATEAIEVSGVVHASPERVYQALLDSTEHTAITGAAATVEPNVGGRFTAFDGVISGSTLDLEPARRIVQSWRSGDFPFGSEDSRLEIVLEPIESGTRITFMHSEIPEGQATHLEEGWRERYLEPMGRYFDQEPSSADGVEEEEAEETDEIGLLEEPVAPRKPAAAKPRKVAAPKPAAKKAAPAPRKAAARKKAGSKKTGAKKASKAAQAKSRKPAGKKGARKSKGAKRGGSKKSARRAKR